MLTIETHKSLSAAQRARKVIVKAQRRVDKTMEKVWGQPVFPAAKDAYLVVRRGDRYELVIDDPSLPQ
jgi:hypothetical protein